MPEIIAFLINNAPKKFAKYITEINKLNFIFSGSDWRLGKYGVDQGILKDLMNDPASYKAFKDVLKSKYKMTDFDADRTMRIMDSIGACSYAAFANTIIANYKDNPEQFQKDFGFSLYVQDSNGNLVINDAELFADIYIFCNSKNNGGKVFDTDSTGQYLLVDVQNLKTDPNFFYVKYKDELLDQEYLSGSDIGWDEELINKYIHSKVNYLDFKQTGTIGSKEYFKRGWITESQVCNNPLEIKSEIQQTFARGDMVQLAVWNNNNNNNNITLHGMNGSKDSTIVGAHAMFVTRADDDKVIVSSWGREYFITYEDLLNSQTFRFDFSQLEDNNVIARSNDVDIINNRKHKGLAN